MKIRPLIFVFISLVLIVSLIPGCKQEVADISAPPDSSSLEFDQSELLQLRTLQTIAVENNELIHRGGFHATARTDKIGQFPCASCHDKKQLERVASEIDYRSGHMDIQLNHGDESILKCQLCHNYADLGSLALLNKKPLDFNHSYQLCMQCHFQQGKDWAGGAHGKRLAGWKGKRVIMNCTDCHNPHSPSFEKRWPKQFPNVPRSGKE